MYANTIKILFCVMLLCSITVYSASSFPIKIDADEVRFIPNQNLSTAKGKVKITYGDYSLECDEVRLHRETMDYEAKGKVVATIADRGTWKAEAVKGNLKKKTIEFGPFNMHNATWYSSGEDGKTNPDGTHSLHHTWLTTCDKECPHYSIKATTVNINTEKKTFNAWNNVLRIGPVPIFYLPYIWGTTDNSSGILFKPGYSGERGAFLRLGFVKKHDNGGSSQIFTDFMSKRGVAIGEQTRYNTDKREVRTDLYALHDRDTTETEDGRNRRFKSEDDRYRLHLYWREQIDDNWSIRVNADMLSDISMLEDWFKKDYKHTYQPKSFMDVSYDNSWMNMTLDFRPRINTFYTVVERLPELKLTIPEQRVFDDLPITYSSENSLGYYSMKWRNNDYPRNNLFVNANYLEDLNDYESSRRYKERFGDPRDYSAFRADTLHTFKANFDLGDVLTLTPRASFRATGYSKTSKNKVSQEDLANNFAADDVNRTYSAFPVNNYDSDGGARVRLATEFGIEGRSKFYSDWTDFKCDWLNVSQTRHVIEPYFNYTFAPDPSVDRDEIYFFDEIDRLERQNFLRLGVDQRWQSRDPKTGKIRTFLSWQSYTDVHARRGEETNRCWGDWGNRIEFSPDRAFSTWGVLLHDVGAGDIQRGEVGLRVGAMNEINFSSRYIYRNDHMSRSVYSMGSSLADFTGESSYIKKYFESADTISGTLNIPFNPKTSLQVIMEYDLERCRVSQHKYLLTHEMHCWTACIGVGSSNGDFEVMVMLRLTAFPDVKLDLNI